MKNIIKLSFTFLSAMLLLSSCNSRFSLTKRHYTKGYYFAHSKTKTNTAIKDKASATASPKADIKSPVIVSVEKQAQAEITTAEIKPIMQINTLKTIAQKIPATLNTKMLRHFTPFETKRTVGVSTSYKAKASEEARSLFWIVILVLVILWALGLISGSFGLGILINLLLLIALVLLILWLLRIV